MTPELRTTICRNITARARGCSETATTHKAATELCDELIELSKALKVDPSSPTGLRWISVRGGCAKQGSPAGSVHTNGYYVVSFKRKKYYNHRLVLLLSGVTPEDHSHEVDHIDRNRSNNKVSNLRWVTRSENHLNKMVCGAYPWRYATRGKNGKYRAQYWDRRKSASVWVGYFNSPYEAHIAAISHKLEHHWSIGDDY